MKIAVITGASRGLGRELAAELAGRGWSLVLDARGAEALAETKAALRPRLTDGAQLVGLAGDVTDATHRAALIGVATAMGGLDLLVNNASTLGATPLPPLARYPLDELRDVIEVNLIGPLAMSQAALPLLRQSSDPRIVNVSSDASVEAYEGWGGYGVSKAALDHLGKVLHVEEPRVRVWSIDPGDMQTQMHQDAFPGEDISDRPLPAFSAALIVAFVESDRRSGRYRVADLALEER
jgi:NAD(P)-dependent dehydrogenase (short-subunit alcohol dehydrogenase family)